MGVEVPREEKEGSSQPPSRMSLEPRSQGDGGDSMDADGPDVPPPDDVDHRTKAKWVEERQDRNFENRFGRLVVNEGKSRYINNSFWANLSNEVEDLKGIMNAPSDDNDDDPPVPSEPATMGTQQGWVFGFSSQNVDLLSLHPLPNQIREYWEVYKDRVDPLVKVLHIPSMEPTILAASSNLTGLSRGFEAFMFAIYYGATTSMGPAECKQKFGEEKSVLLARYRFAIQQALARANFLLSEEIIVLQAFTVFLICLRRNNDARVIWTLTGLVVRIAQTIGVHRDGLHFNLAPFEVEMRRRLWWQVCILDTRASEDHGCDPTIIEQGFDTKMPLNINDSDLTPDMAEFPPERQGCTDMSFCLIRFEVANTFRRINYIPPGPPETCTEYSANVTLQDKEKWITECHQRLEERYLKHCDMTVPLFWVTATVARLMMSKMWLMVYHPFQRHDGGASLTQETKEKLFITSLENIEYSLLLETESRTMKWGWLFKTYMQWHALAFILSELCHRTTGDLVERAWIAVDKTRDGRWGMHSTTDSPAGHLWRPLKKLYRKAAEARQRGLQNQRSKPQPNIPSRNVTPTSKAKMGQTGAPMTNNPSHLQPPSQAQAQATAPAAHQSNNSPLGRLPADNYEFFRNSTMSTGVAVDDNPDAMDTSRQRPNARMQPSPPHNTAPNNNLNTNLPNAYLPQQQQQQQPPNLPHQPPPTPVAPLAPQFSPNPFYMNHNPHPMARTNPSNHMDFHPTPNNHPPNLPNFGTAHVPPHQQHPPPLTAGPNNPGPNDPNVHLNTYNPWSPTGGGPDTGLTPSSSSADLSAMDTSGDLNWESWDQLVRQFGTNVDQRSLSGGGAGFANDGGGGGGGVGAWGGGVGGGAAGGGAVPNWEMLANGTNLRLGMGMGGGDWF